VAGSVKSGGSCCLLIAHLPGLVPEEAAHLVLAEDQALALVVDDAYAGAGRLGDRRQWRPNSKVLQSHHSW